MITKAWRCRGAVIGGLLLVLSLSGPGILEAARLKPVEVKAQYRQILEILASQGNEVALAELVEWEQAVLGSEEVWKFTEDFFRNKLRVLRDLIQEQSVDLLMPVILLHHDAYFVYRELGRNHLAQHSRQMAVELAESYAKRSESLEALEYGSSIITSFGVGLWSPSSIAESWQLFFRASEVDPGNRVAILGLAAAYERNGDYGKAIGYLGRQMTLDPDDSEARLRLALCHLRDPGGAVGVAVRVLTDLIRDEQSPWIQSVAYQELVRYRLASGEVEAARELLEEGLAQYPSDQQLLVLQAAILDADLLRYEVDELLARIEDEAWERESPRYRYDRWIPPTVEEMRVRLGEMAQSGLAPLRVGLSTLAPSEDDEE